MLLNPFLLIQWLCAFLFAIGLLMVILRRNIMIILMGIELMLNAAALSFVSFSRQYMLIEGPLSVVFVIVIAAAESAIGLSLLIHFYRHFGVTRTEKAQVLKEHLH